VCGIPSVRQMLMGMTSSEVTDLIDWARVPFGEKRADLRAALQSAHASFRKPGAPSPDIDDFALHFEGEEYTTDPEADIVKILNAIPGARRIDNG